MNVDVLNATKEGHIKTAMMKENKQVNRIIKMAVRHLRAFFGEAEVLKDINMDIFANQVTAIIGPSGCGKSTFIRSLNRMHEVVPGARIEGTVFLDDVNVYGGDIHLVELRRKVGMVFQRPNVFPTLSIYGNVAAGLKLTGRIRKSHLDNIVEEALTKAALWDEVKDRLNTSAMQLSGGQQQRICIARALAVNPEVLLMDEPASALDPISTVKIEELIHSLKSNYTIVIVTHNMQQAARVSDYTGFFLLGELIEYDRTVKIFEVPKDKRTEDYITGRFG